MNIKHTILFYLPFVYLYKVRLHTPGKLLSWLLVYPALVFAYILLAVGTFTWSLVGMFALQLIGIFSLYEFGYIHNDSVAVLNESNPTLRLSEQEQNFCTSQLYSILAVRMLLCIGCQAVLIASHPNDILWWVSASLSVLVIPIFLMYNYWRSRSNVFAYAVLVCARYIPLLLPYLNNSNLRFAELLLISYPLLIAIERFSIRRYRYPIIRQIIRTEEDKTWFRVAYYLLVSALLTALYNIKGLPYVELTPIYILSLYRLFILVLTQIYTPKHYLGQ